jgi:hypothetical protein
MTLKLKDGTINVAVALTEGLTAGIANGQDWYKIVGTYVSAPLCTNLLDEICMNCQSNLCISSHFM